MKIRELRILLTLAEELHFGKAADRLGMAQPQLSEIIKRLEADAGFQLFQRRPRVRPTPGGEILIASARSAMIQLEAAAREARSVAAGTAGRVRLGFSAFAMLTRLPTILSHFAEQYPAVEVHLVERPSAMLRECLERGELDLIVARESHSDGQFDSFEFARDDVNVLLPAGHRLAEQDRIEPVQLSDEPFVLFPRATNPHYHDRLVRWAAASGLNLNIVRELESWIGATALVGVGLNVSFGTRLLARVTFPGVVARPFSVATPDVSFWVTWSADRMSPAAQMLVRLLGSSS